MVTVLLYTLVSALCMSVLPFTEATPVTVTSSSSSSSSSGANYVNGQLVSGHCAASKNGYNSGCNDPNFAGVPDAITTVTPGNFMPPFPPMMNGFPSFPNFNNFGNGFPSFPNFNNFGNGFPSFPNFNNFGNGFPSFNNFNNFGNGFPSFNNFNNNNGFF